MKLVIGNGTVMDKGLPKGFVITDDNVFKKYGHLIKGDKFVIKSGERSKSIENYKKILSKLKDTNTDTIVAFGGGVVGDLAGFVASTYKRGIDFIQIPTTFLSMVDSSLGGKNGVNLGNKKNYIGTIYQPKEVIIDPLFLESLSKKEFQNGVSEVIKYGILFDKQLLHRISKGVSRKDSDLIKIISRCEKIKLDVVRVDEKDNDYRHTLNFGHTIGHSLELLYNLRHGEAISLGMILEMKLGKTRGFFSEEQIVFLKDILIKNGLLVNLPNINIKNILEIMKGDKKGEFIFSLSKKDYNVKFTKREIIKVLENEQRFN